MIARLGKVLWFAAMIFSTAFAMLAIFNALVYWRSDFMDHVSGVDALQTGVAALAIWGLARIVLYIVAGR